MAGLAVLAYLPALALPFIADDYVQISLARDFAQASGWERLIADPLYRCRATSLILTYWTERIFGLHPFAYNASSLALHILNTWLVFALGVWRVVGWRIAGVAAAFFAVYEGHQEAIIWYSALPELLVFFFSLLAVICWILWLQSPERRWYWVATMVFYLLALASKESAVALVPLLILILWVELTQWRQRLIWVAPFAAMALVYAGLIFAAQSSHLHFNDAGTFSVHAPFWIAWSRSFIRLFWIWGLLAVLALAIWRERKWLRLVAIAAAWVGITLLPYSFLTYMPRVPSRHTYFASAGLALVVSAGFLTFRDRMPRRWAAAALATFIIVHNCGYLWIKKQAQYRTRAAPTEALLKFSREVDGPVYLHCFPYDVSIAQSAVKLRWSKKLIPMISSRSMAEIDNKSVVFCSGDHRPASTSR